MTDPYKNNAFVGSGAHDNGGFSANQSKPWRNNFFVCSEIGFIIGLSRK